jgi:hypothetical protein
MKDRVVMVLTSRSFDAMVTDGGCGNWKAKEDSIRRCKWIVAVRNRHSDWTQGGKEHGTAFLIGRIVGVKPSAKYPNRLVVTFDRFATLNKPNAWPSGLRNPVSYTDLEALGINPEKLKWQEFPGHGSVAESEVRTGDTAGEQRCPADVLDTAKLMIARSLGLDPSVVRISSEI